MLTDLPNLGVLLIRHAYNELQRLDDKAMRDWGRVVQEKGAFTQLRVLGLHYHPASLRATLKSLASFPNLRLCSVEPHTPIPSVQSALSEIASASLPFEMFPVTSPANGDDPEAVDPEAIWSRQDMSGKSFR